MKALYTGYKNAILRNDYSTEQKAQKRLNICKVCPYKKERLGVSVCGLCGCPLVALSRQNEKICNNWKKFNLK